MKTRLFFGVMCIALILAAPAAQATAVSVYNSGAPDGPYGYDLTYNLEAMDFSLTSPQTTFDHVRFWALDDNPIVSYLGSINWTIYADSGSGSPGSSQSSGNAASPTITNQGLTPAGWTLYQFDFGITSQTLTAGTTYWLGLHNGSTSGPFPPDLNFLWQTTTATPGIGSFGFNIGTGGPWVANFADGVAPPLDRLAFQLYDGNPVPLPGAVWLLGSGLLGLIGLRKKLRS